MKTTKKMRTETIEQVNRIVYKTTGQDKQGNPVHIKISLDDDCKNGHADFLVTATVYEKDKPKNDRNTICSGCCHKEILEARPDLKLFVDLHLADSDGVPMYAIANGFYHLKNSSAKVAREYIRATQSEFEQIATSEDESVFQYWVEKLGILKRWKSEANQAIALLEEWTGLKFKDESTRKAYKKLNGKAKEIEARMNKGYYSPESIKARVDEKEHKKQLKIVADLREKRAKAINKIDREFTVKMAVHNAGLPLDNFIFYDHTNEGAFNWMDFDFRSKITQAQLDAFLKSEAYKAIPFKVDFKLAKGK